MTLLVNRRPPHIRGTGAPTTPTGSDMQASPIRSSHRRKVVAKLGDLPRYKKQIVEAIKANPGKREKALSAALEASCSVVADHNALRKYCSQHDLWSVKPDPMTPSRVLSGKRKIGEAM